MLLLRTVTSPVMEVFDAMRSASLTATPLSEVKMSLTAPGLAASAALNLSPSSFSVPSACVVMPQARQRGVAAAHAGHRRGNQLAHLGLDVSQHRIAEQRATSLSVLTSYLPSDLMVLASEL